VLVALGVFSVLLVAPFSGDEETTTVKVTGLDETVFDWSSDACEDLDYPDLSARAYRDDRGRVHLIASHFIARPFSGPSLNDLSHSCRPVFRSDRDPNPAHFDDMEWISSLYTRDGKKVYALLHDEYQGYLHGSRICPSGVYAECWYNAVTLATSSDGGQTFRHAAPPRQLVATIPERYKPDGGQAGMFAPTNIVKSSDGYYYSMVHTIGYDHKSGVCLMRTDDLSDARSWRGWDGNGFDLVFQDPYSSRSADERCAFVAREAIQDMSYSLTYNTYLEKFVLVGYAAEYDRLKRQTVWGIYFSVSDDLVHWSRRKLLKEVELQGTYRCGDSNPVQYFSVLDPESKSRSFDTVGKTAYLYFTRLNYENCELSADRDLMRFPIEFSK
jgi:hypothetical protein